jgi:hypothetical protein
MIYIRCEAGMGSCETIDVPSNAQHEHWVQSRIGSFVLTHIEKHRGDVQETGLEFWVEER